jgi:hypothetical protein
MKLSLTLVPLLTIGLAACGDPGHDHDHGNEAEVITTVVLRFLPSGGGSALEFTWADPEDDGSPVIDDITLADADDYDVTVSFLNELEDPAEDITAEVEDESDQHQVFFTGSAVKGPATGTAVGLVTHAYADEDVNGLPVGLENTFTTDTTGNGELIVTLRHMPPENDSPVKLDGAAEDVAAGGFASIGGDNDAQVTFNLTVE